MNMKESLKDGIIISLDLVKKYIKKDDVEGAKKLLKIIIHDLEII